MINHRITVGLSTIYKKEGSSSDALPATGITGILDYLISTPAILTMIIEASSALLDPLLPEGYITVGKNIELSHENPTMVDGTISIVLTVTGVGGNRIHLNFSGHDAIGEVCKGRYERVIVKQNDLLDVVYKRTQSMP
ncbi:MAG: hypothetical protein WCF96_05790 [Eubacteriales bacterium]